MEREAFQKLIDSGTTAERMTCIAGEYLRGSVIRDLTAAEGWLMKAIEEDDPVYSPRAMGILAREILKKKQVIPPGDVADLLARLPAATDRERSELEALLQLI